MSRVCCRYRQTARAHLAPDKGGAPVLVIAGQKGQLYRVEQSTDLNEWKVFRIVEGLAKPVEVSVPAALAGGTRFYRTVTRVVLPFAWPSG